MIKRLYDNERNVNETTIFNPKKKKINTCTCINMTSWW